MTVITGMGLITAYGSGTAAYWKALLTGARALRPHPALAAEGFERTVTAAIDDALFGDAPAVRVPAARVLGGTAGDQARARDEGPARRSRLARVAAQQALDHAGLTGLGHAALVVTVGQTPYAEPGPNPRWRSHDLAGPHPDELPGLSPHTETVYLSQACASVSFALDYARSWLRSGCGTTALVVGTSVLNAYEYAGMAITGALSPLGARPFDTGRDGTSLGEGAGAIVLERADAAERRGARAYAVLAGVAARINGRSPAASDEDAIADCVSAALDDAGLDRVGYVHAHATGTVQGDTVELAARRRGRWPRLARRAGQRPQGRRRSPHARLLRPRHRRRPRLSAHRHRSRHSGTAPPGTGRPGPAVAHRGRATDRCPAQRPRQQLRLRREQLLPRPDRTGWEHRMIRRLRARADYAWRHSAEPAVAQLRRLYEGELRAALPRRAVHTRGADGGPTASYTGPYEIGKGLMAQVETHTGSAGAPAAGGPELVLVAASARRLAALPRARALLLPARVHQIVPIRGDLATVLAGRSRRNLDGFRRNRRKHGWTLEHAGSDQDLDFFHRRMLLPTVRDRYGAYAVSEDPTVMRECLLRQGHLFFVRAGGPDGERIAGALCRWDERRRTLRFRLTGVLDADPALRKAGALIAAEYFVFDWAWRNGVAAVDLSGGAPFLARPIVQYKMRLNAELVPAPTPVRHLAVRLHAARDTPAVRDFLSANPLLAKAAGGGLEAVYFHDRTRPVRDDVAWRSPGVVRSRIVDLDEFLTGQPELDGGSSSAPAPAATVVASPPTAGLPSTFHEGGRRWHTGRS
ncbi:beta-ketoacyl synthase N-terminal-like domain-containing protein [Streptomyces sp. NPDC020681]|uniref:beta-ketoacyl synthase N-terminal-like domain-containing protein n=1 Tax=Streptomyces sp. NPDC020681 TaxID=3365083 RepID=UPI00378DD2D0